MIHHITVEGRPLCSCKDLETEGVYCNHLTLPRAKSGILRLIELNPEYPICEYAVVSGVCPADKAARERV